MATEIKTMTNKFRATFVNVFQPNSESDKYEITMVFDSEKDIANIKQAVKDYLEEQGLPAKGIEMPWKSGDEKADKDEKYEWMRGKVLVSAKTKYPVKVVDQRRQDIINSEEFYSGCYARCVIQPYAWEFKKKKGIGFNPLAIQKMADGERLGGGINVEDYFEELESVEVETDFDL